jgi:GAF domain-containing protein
MPVNRDGLEAGLARLEGRASDDVALEALVEEAVAAVHVAFGLSGAGLLLMDEQQGMSSVAATDSAGAALEETQEEAGEGPCVDCLMHHRTVRCTDLATDPRYSRVGPPLAERGVHAVLGVPVAIGGVSVGALNCYVSEPHEWSDAEEQALAAYAELLGRALGSALVARRQSALAAQLQYALDYRVVIERAVGFVMARDGVDAVTAFDGLRRLARDRRRRVADVAAGVLYGARVD